MAQYSGIYRHYEGSNAQCSGTQMERELTFTSDLKKLRYFGRSGLYFFYNTDQIDSISGTLNNKISMAEEGSGVLDYFPRWNSVGTLTARSQIKQTGSGITVTGFLTLSGIAPSYTAASIYLTTVASRIKSRTAGQVLTDISGVSETDFRYVSGVLYSGYIDADVDLSGLVISGYTDADRGLSGILLSGYVRADSRLSGFLTSGYIWSDSSLSGFIISGYIDADRGLSGILISGYINKDRLLSGQLYSGYVAADSVLSGVLNAKFSNYSGFNGYMPVWNATGTLTESYILQSGNLVVINSGLYTKSGRRYKTTRITAGPYYIQSTDYALYCNTNASNITVNLPIGINGTNYRITNCGRSGHYVVVNPSGANKLFGSSLSGKLYDGEDDDIIFETTEGWW